MNKTNHNTILRTATEADIPIIRRLAEEIWWPTYRDYIAHGQIQLMLELIYSEEALQNQLREGQRFTLAVDDSGVPIGFIGFQQKPAAPAIMRIEKLYLNPTQQGRGIGQALINHVGQLASNVGCSLLELNVNRNNPAAGFYRRLGFEIVDTVDIPYHDYVLNDYVMQCRL